MRLFQLKEDDAGTLTAKYVIYSADGKVMHEEDIDSSEVSNKLVELFFMNDVLFASVNNTTYTQGTEPSGVEPNYVTDQIKEARVGIKEKQ